LGIHQQNSIADRQSRLQINRDRHGFFIQLLICEPIALTLSIFQKNVGDLIELLGGAIV